MSTPAIVWFMFTTDTIHCILLTIRDRTKSAGSDLPAWFHLNKGISTNFDNRQKDKCCRCIDIQRSTWVKHMYRRENSGAKGNAVSHLLPSQEAEKRGLFNIEQMKNWAPSVAKLAIKYFQSRRHSIRCATTLQLSLEYCISDNQY